MLIIYNGIWRAGDLAKFPRYLFKPTEIIKFLTVQSGYAYVRSINATLLGRDMFAITAFDQLEGYGPYRRPSKSLVTEK